MYKEPVTMGCPTANSESRYVTQINKCKRLVDEIRGKVGVMIVPELKEALGKDSPMVSALERELNSLEEKMIELLEDIRA